MGRFARLRLFILLVCSIMVLMGVTFVVLHLTTPSDGARFTSGLQGAPGQGVEVTVLREQPGGLRTGDIVTSIDGVSVDSSLRNAANPLAERPSLAMGQTVSYGILRDGSPLIVSITLGRYPLDAVWARDWSTIVYGLLFELIAVYVVLRRPRELAPLILLLVASGSLAATTWSFGLQASDLIGGAGLWLYQLTTLGCYTFYHVAAIHFALIYPKPFRLVARRRWVIPALYLTTFMLLVLPAAIAFPSASSMLSWLNDQVNGAGTLITLVLLLFNVVAVMWSYRVHRDVETRQKIRWFMFGALIAIASSVLLTDIPPLLGVKPLIDDNVLGLLVLSLPLSIAIAILRHRLFDIDTILNRTIVYGGLSAVVIGIYVAIVGGFGSLFQVGNSPLLSLSAAAVVAVAFQPLRGGLQRGVDRLMFGERDNPYEVLTRLGRRLEEALAPEAVLPTIVETIAQALRLPSATLALKQGGDFAAEVAFGVPTGVMVTFPLIYHHDVVGQLRVSQRAPDEPFNEREKHLLEDMAHQAGIAVHAAQLTDDLQRSRARLVNAREEERRRMRRDLHDGVGPALAGLSLKVGAIRNLGSSDPALANSLLAELGSEIESVVTDIRQLVYALRPPALDDLGLVGALRAQASRLSRSGVGNGGSETLPAMTVHFEVPEVLPTLPAAVEVATYRIASEALSNVARHALARTCTVRLIPGAAFQLEVTDDGVGLPQERVSGVGLISMRERAEELGGSCTIAAIPGHGTRVLATLPLAKKETSEFARDNGRTAANSHR